MSVPFYIVFPSGNTPSVYTGVTSATGDIMWHISSSDPAGVYTLGFESGTGSQSFSMTKGGSNVVAANSMANPGVPNFSIGGIAAGNPPFGSVIRLYKCGTGATMPLTNTSTRLSYIGKYRFTVYSSDVNGAIIGAPISQTAWLSAFPSSLALPSTPTGLYYKVRLETQNTCGLVGNAFKDAWIIWFNGEAPTVYQLSRSAPNCAASSTSTNNSSNAASPHLMTPFSGGTVAWASPNFLNGYTQHRKVSKSAIRRVYCSALQL